MAGIRAGVQSWYTVGILRIHVDSGEGLRSEVARWVLSEINGIICKRNKFSAVSIVFSSWA